MTSSIIRPATAADLPGIKAIYDHQVEHAVSTFDLEAPPLSYWQTRLASTDVGDHLVVAEDGDGDGDGSGHGDGSGGGVLGYAYSSTYRPRPAYARTRETSVYLASEAGGRGLGRALYDDLLARLRSDGVHTVLAVVALPNPVSEALHRACGFTQVGVLPEVGHKLGRWIDTGLWALRLEVAADER